MTRSVTIGIVCMMLLAGIAGLIAVLPLNAAGDSSVIGEIAVDTTWTKANGPYYVEGDIHVPLGVTLTIEAGVEVYVNGSYNFWVDGNLTLAGLPGQTVNMTSNQTTPGAGDWGIIQVNSTGNLSINHALIMHLNSIQIYNAPHIRIENLTLMNSSSYGLYMSYADYFILKHLYFEYTGNDALYTYYCDFGNITDFTYSGNSRGWYAYYCYYTTVNGFYIRYTSNQGFYLQYCRYSHITDVKTAHRVDRFYFYYCDYSSITDSYLSAQDTSWGLYLYDNDYFVIDNVSIVQSTWYTRYGLYISYCQYLTLRDIYLDFQEYNLVFDHVWTNTESYFNYTIENCYIRTLPILAYNEVDDLVFDNPACAGIVLFKCDNAKFTNVSLNMLFTIHIWWCDSPVLKDINITDSYYGVVIKNSDNALLENVEIYSPGNYPLFAYYNDFLTINNCKFIQYGSYTYMYECDFLNFTNNLVIDDWYGINVEWCAYGVFKNNDIHGTRSRAFYIYGSNTEMYYNHTVTTDNLVNGRQVNYYFKQSGIFLQNVNLGHVSANFCQDVTLDNVDVRDQMNFFGSDGIKVMNLQKDYQFWYDFYGIYAYYTDDIQITNINMSYLYDRPLYFSQCWNVNITHNEFYKTYEVYTSGGWYYNVSNNKFIEIMDESLNMNSNRYSIIANNYAYKCSRSFYLNDLDYSVISGNRVVWTQSDNNMDIYNMNYGWVTNNVLERTNSHNLYMPSCSFLNITQNFFNQSFSNYGLYMTGGSWNDIWHNGFILNAISAYDDQTTNVWYNETLLEGNLWSDYTGVDVAPKDGIGDTPYDLDGDTFDQYPLMDPYPPSISLLSPANNSFITPGTPVMFSVTDFNTKNVIYWEDYGFMGDFLPPYNVDTTLWGEGVHQIDVYANDTMGNEVLNWFQFIVDTLPPTITMLSPGNNSFVNGDVDIDFEILDTYLDMATITLSIDGAFPQPYDPADNISINGTWSQGLHTFELTAFDDAGNGNTAVFFISLDSTIPQIELISPMDGSTIEAGDPIDFSIYDNALDKGEYSVNGGPWIRLPPPFDVDTSYLSGDIALDVRAFDKAGNTNSGSFNFKVQDTTKPKIVLFSPADRSVILPGTILDFDVLDNALDNVTFKVDGGAFKILPIPYDVDTTGWSTGAHDVTIIAEDVSKNIVEKKFTFFADEQAPSIKLVGPAENSFINRNTNIVFDIQDNYVLGEAFYRVNNWVWRPMPNGFTVHPEDFLDGENTIDVKAIDSVGNEAERSFKFKLDSIKPVITLVEPENGATIKSATAIKMVISDENLASVFAETDGGNGSIIDSPYVVSTASWMDGKHILKVEAKDVAGNIAVAEFWFVIDLTPPQVESTQPYDGADKVPVTKEIKVVFNEPMNKGKNITDVEVSGVTSLKFRWSDNGRVLWINAGTLEYNTTYTITLNGLEDAQANALAEYEFTFTTVLENAGGGTGTGDDDDEETGGKLRPPLPDSEAEEERNDTKKEKNVTWVVLIALVLAALLVIFLLFRISKRWSQEDGMADDAIWRSRYENKPQTAAIVVEQEDGDEYDSEPPEPEEEPDLEEPEMVSEEPDEEPEVLEGEPVEDDVPPSDPWDKEDGVDDDFVDEVVEPPPPMEEEDDGLLPPPEVS